jgi:hypothetical protein
MSVQDDLSKIRGQIAELKLRLNDVRAVVSGGVALTASRLVVTNAAGQLASNVALAAGYMPYATAAGAVADSPLYRASATAIVLGGTSPMTDPVAAQFTIANATNAALALVGTNSTGGYACFYLRNEGGDKTWCLSIRDLAETYALKIHHHDGASWSAAILQISTAGVITVIGQIVSSLAIGTMPLNVTSTTKCTNLNVDLVDGVHIAALAIGDILYASATTNLAALADVAVGSYLRSGGVGAAPLWSTLILPNSATAFRLPVAMAANTIGELAAVGATGEYLAGVTGAIPAWATLNQAAIAGLTASIIESKQRSWLL